MEKIFKAHIIDLINNAMRKRKIIVIQKKQFALFLNEISTPRVLIDIYDYQKPHNIIENDENDREITNDRNESFISTSEIK